MIAADIFITLVVAFTGGFIAKKLHIPMASMAGALIFVIILGLTTQHSCFPEEAKVIVQCFSGALIGQKITAKDVKELRYLVLPSIVQLLSMLVLNLVFGLLMYYVGGLDITTALFASAPGGVQDMSLIAADYGANAIYVSIMHILRMVCIVAFMPSFYKLLIRSEGRQPVSSAPHKKPKLNETIRKSWEELCENKFNFLLTIVVAFAGGLLFRALGVKAGAMIGSILSTTCLSLFANRVYLPKKTKSVTQACAGAYIGAMLDRNALKLLPVLIVPIVIMIVGLFVFVWVAGIVMRKTSHLDMLSCLLISTPGGIQEMSLMAQEYDCDVSKVAVLHLVRIIAALCFFPQLLGWLDNWL